MVIQPNMSPRAIVEVWEETKGIFEKYDVSLTNQPLNQLVGCKELELLLQELNQLVGSSGVTCTEGG